MTGEIPEPPERRAVPSHFVATQRDQPFAADPTPTGDQTNTPALSPPDVTGPYLAKSDTDPSAGVDIDVLGNLGEYALLAEIARGGMGIVYRARHRKLNRVVALKVARAGELTSAGEAQRFQVEAQAVARLDHPHIVPIYEVGEVNGLHYFSMALVEGQSLAQRVSERPLPPREAAQIMLRVAEAMAYAHANGVIHRDLKPSNILVDAGGQPRVTDFGLAKRANADSSLTQAGQVMGTPSYMPPEQAEGKVDQVGPLADVYSLGATLYCVLTGRPPFQAASVVDTLKQVVEREPLPPHQLNPAVDLDLDTICLKCLEKRPQRRYASAAALAEDLQRFLEDRPIQARRVSELEKLTRWCRRNRLLVSSLAAVVATFVAGFVLISWSYLRAEDARKGEERQRQAADLARDAAEEREKAERWERYRANIAAASSALQLYNVESARRYLDAAPTEHRNWEWRHLHSRLDVSRAVVRSNGNVLWMLPHRTRSLQFELTPKNGQIRVIDPRDGQETAVLRTGPGERISLFPSPAGTRVAIYEWIAGQADAPAGTVRLLDVRTGGETAGWQFSKSDLPLVFSPDSRHAVLRTTGGNLRLVDVADNRKTFALGMQPGLDYRKVAFSADSRRVAVVREDSFLTVADTATGERIADIRLENRELAYVLALSPDGTRIVTGAGYPDNGVRLWDVTTGKATDIARGFDNYVSWVDFSPDGSRVAACSMDQSVRLFDGRDLSPIAVMRGHGQAVLQAQFSPDSRRLLSCSQDRTLRLWNGVTGDPVAVLLGHLDTPIRLAFSQDSNLAISEDSSKTCRVWDVKRLERNVLRGHTSYVYDIAVSVDGKRLASAAWDGTVRLWDVATGVQTDLLKHDQEIVGGVAFSPDGKLLASVPRNDTVCIWDLSDAKRRHTLKASTGWMTDSHVAFNRQGTLVAQGGRDTIVRLWNPLTGEPAGELRAPELPIGTDVVSDVTFSPDGSLLAVAYHKHLRIWDLATRQTVAVLTGHTDFVQRVAFSNDGRLIASCGDDGTALLWDATTYRELATLSHGSKLYGLAFSPDGTRLATACADNSIRLWDIGTCQEVAELRGHTAYVHAVAFSPDGTRLFSASGDFTVRIWDTMSSDERARRQ